MEITFPESDRRGYLSIKVRFIVLVIVSGNSPTHRHLTN
jgi:hypothetical protein